MDPTVAYLAGMFHLPLRSVSGMHMSPCPCRSNCGNVALLGMSPHVAAINLLTLAAVRGKGAQA